MTFDLSSNQVVPTAAEIDAVAVGYVAEWSVLGLQGSFQDARKAALLAFAIDRAA